MDQEMVDGMVTSSTPSSPSTRERNPGSQPDRWRRRGVATQLRPLMMSPSFVHENEDNKSCNKVTFIHFSLSGQPLIPGLKCWT